MNQENYWVLEENIQTREYSVRKFVQLREAYNYWSENVSRRKLLKAIDVMVVEKRGQ